MTNARGVAAVSIAEHTFALILAFTFPVAVAAKTDVLTDATVIPADKHDVSPRLADIPPKIDTSTTKKEKAKKEKGYQQLAGAAGAFCARAKFANKNTMPIIKARINMSIFPGTV